jgi:hypothetical protein
MSGPVLAGDEAGSSETQTVQRSCGAPSSKSFSPESGAGQNECKNPTTGQHDDSRTYTATEYTNNVKCGSSGQVQNTPVGHVYATGTPSPSGHAGLCNDGTGAVPVQGRAMVAGSDDEGGLHVVVDGDKDNTQNAAAQGWIKVGGTTAGPYVTCGDDAGRKDSDNATADDAQGDCGP